MNKPERRRIASLVLAAALLLATVFEAGMALAAFSPYYSRCTTAKLRVRTTAGGDIKDHLEDKQLVWVIGESTQSGSIFYNIEFVNSKNQRDSGWVCYKGDGIYYLKDLSSSEVNNLSYRNGNLPGGKTSGGGGSSVDVSKYGYLKLGSRGDGVKQVQTRLKALKMYSGDITGNFGQKTQDAVRAFQRKNRLVADGVAGPKTLQLLLGSGSGSSGSSGSSGGSSSSSDNAGSYGITTADKVFLRTRATTSSPDRAMLKKGEVVYILGTEYVGSYNWYYVQLDGGKGYIRSDLMRILTAAETAAYLDGNKPNPGSGGTGGSGTTPATSGTATITGSTVHVREKPDITSPYITKWNKGTTADIVKSETVTSALTGKAEVWYCLKKGSVQGWVLGTYVQAGSSGSNNNNNSSTEDVDDGTYRTLKYGSSGADVKKLQTALKTLKYYYGELTGNFGTRTEAAVKAFQRAKGLTADGIAGPATQVKLYESGGTINNPDVSIGSVENIDWYNKFKPGNLWGKKGTAVVTDVLTGRSWNIVCQSLGNHADVEPATANDTAIMMQVYGVSKVTSIPYNRRPVWLTLTSGNGKGRTFAGSIYGVPHGDKTIPNNNFPGQFCIHLLGSKTHVGNSVDAAHQAQVKYAYQHAAKQGASDVKY